jgi:hypothetical protein
VNKTSLKQRLAHLWPGQDTLGLQLKMWLQDPKHRVLWAAWFLPVKSWKAIQPFPPVFFSASFFLNMCMGFYGFIWLYCGFIWAYMIYIARLTMFDSDANLTWADNEGALLKLRDASEECLEDVTGQAVSIMIWLPIWGRIRLGYFNIFQRDIQLIIIS